MSENDHNAGLAAGDSDTTAATPQRQAHTPGPWLISDDGLLVYALHHYGWEKGKPRMVNRFSAQIQAYTGQGGTVDEALANALLIAAAPDLFAVVKAYVAACEEQGLKLGPITGDARAAIAKAEGKP